MKRKTNHKPLNWISENCTFPMSAGKEFAKKKVGPYLLPFQKKIIKEVLNRDGSINKNVYIYGCRKISKTFIFSMICWYLINDPNRRGYKISAMASVLYQAKLIYDQLINQGYKRNDVRFYMESIRQHLTGARIDFFANTPGSVLGQESDALVADEIGVFKNDDTLLNLSTGGSLAPDKFLKLFSQNPPLTDDHFSTDFIKQCDKDPTFKVHRFYLPKKYDWTDEKSWAIANPFLQEYFESNGKRFSYVMRFYRDFYNRALTSKREEHAFRRYLLGQFTGSDTEYIPVEKIKEADESIYKESGIRWVVGIDYSITHDFTAGALVGWSMSKNKIYVKPFLYLPNVGKRRDVQKRMFQQWEDAGYIVIQKQNVLNGQEVADDIISYLVDNKINPEAVCFDRALAGHHVEHFKQFKRVEVKMTGQQMTTSIRELERVGCDYGLHIIGENQALKWMFSNVIVSQKSKNYVLMNRITASQNIDGPVAITLGLKYLLDNKKKLTLIRAI